MDPDSTVTVGAKLNYLFAHRRRPDNKPYTLRQVVEAIDSGGQTHVGASYLSRLRKWPERHPDALIPARRAAIARFFGVDPSYFDPHCPVDQPPWLEFQPGHSPADALEQGGLTNGVAIPEDVARIYSRALSMSPQQRQIWLEMADFIDRMGTQTIVAAACT